MIALTESLRPATLSEDPALLYAMLKRYFELLPCGVAFTARAGPHYPQKPGQ
jgi:hypothetical protein